MAAIPVPNPRLEAGRAHQTIQGEVPSAQKPPSGCRFHPRCVHAMPVCSERTPELRSEGGASVACHLYG
jgi:oligopeptide transport system ATP-binding protein